MDEFEFVAFHPMVNTATTAITNEDMKKVIEMSGHKATILDFSSLAEEAAAPKQ